MRILHLVAGSALVVGAHAAGQAESPAYEGPVIDVHLHAYAADANGPPGTPMCPGLAEFGWDGREAWPTYLMKEIFTRSCNRPIKSSMTDEKLRDETIHEMRAHKVRGLLGGSAGRVSDWVAAAPDLFWPARHLDLKRDRQTTPESLASAFKAGKIVAIAEITNQYSGIMADDPRMDPFWAMAEKEGIPVGVHVGGIGPPGAVHLYPAFRIQNPARLAEVLSAHPKLRLFVMHAGFPFIDDMKALLYIYPQLMLDISVLQFATPRAEYHAFLQELVRAGFADRVMFGSDQMNWPGAIGLGIEAVNEAPYLTLTQKRMILHDNAARFLRLDANGRPSR